MSVTEKEASDIEELSSVGKTAEESELPPPRRPPPILLPLPWIRWAFLGGTVFCMTSILLLSEHQTRQWVPEDLQCYWFATEEEREPPPLGMDQSAYPSCYKYFDHAAWQVLCLLLGSTIWSIIYFTDLIVTKCRGRSSGVFDIYIPKDYSSNPRRNSWCPWIPVALGHYGLWQLLLQALGITRSVDIYYILLYSSVVGPMMAIFSNKTIMWREGYGCLIIVFCAFLLGCWGLALPDGDFYYTHWISIPFGFLLGLLSLLTLTVVPDLSFGKSKKTKSSVIEGPAWIGIYGPLITVLLMLPTHFLGKPISNMSLANEANSTVLNCTIFLTVLGCLVTVGMFAVVLWFDSLTFTVPVVISSTCFAYLIRLGLGWGRTHPWPTTIFPLCLLGCVVYLFGFGCCLSKVDAHCNKKIMITSHNHQYREMKPANEDDKVELLNNEEMEEGSSEMEKGSSEMEQGSSEIVATKST